MKIAVLISGEYRAFDICRPTMTFLNDPEIDVYISTWDKTNYKIPKLNYSHSEDITYNRIRNDLGRDAIIRIESATLVTDISDKCGATMMHRWKQGFELIQNSNIDYDYIIITRFDLFFDVNWNTKLYDLNRYTNTLGSAWTSIGKLNDVFLISSYQKMKQLIADLSIDEWVQSNEFDWHTWWYRYASRKFDSIIDYTDMNFTLCRYFVEKGMSFQTISDLEVDWQQLKVLALLDNFPDVAPPWPLEIMQQSKDKWNAGYFNKYKKL